MALNEQIVEAVALGNFKNLGEMQVVNALAHQNRVNLIAEASLSKQLETMNTLDVAEVAGLRALSTSHLSEKMSELLASITTNMQLIKGGSQTPPQST